MLTLSIAVILYVAGFVFLYGVIRVAVRHGLEDLELRRAQRRRSRRSGIAQEAIYLRDRTVSSGN